MHCDLCDGKVTKCPSCKERFSLGDFVMCAEYGIEEHHYHFHDNCIEQAEIKGGEED